MWKFINEKLETVYKFAIIDKWTWRDLMIYAGEEGLEMRELADALAWEITAKAYDRDEDCATDYPWCCPWLWAPSESVLSLEDFSQEYSPEIERLIEEEMEA